MFNFAHVPPVAKRVVPVIVLVALLYYFTHSGRGYAGQAVTMMRSKKTVFLERFLEQDIGPPISGSGIEELCTEDERNPEIVFSCDTAKEGFASVRQHQLQCIRLGIESGGELHCDSQRRLPQLFRSSHTKCLHLASKIVLSNIVKRNEKDFLQKRAQAPSDGIPLGYMLDFEHAHEVLTAHCPGLELHSSLSDLYDVPSLLQPVDVAITDDMLNVGSVLKDPESWEMKLWHRIDEDLPVASRHYPVRIRLMNDTSHFPVYADGAETAREIGSLVRPQPYARRIAGSTLFALSQRFNLGVDPWKTPDRDSFIGVHLRIEKDGEKLKFPSYGTQAAAALEYITTTDAKVVFLATGGSRADIDGFKTQARDHGVTVVTKEDLLEDDDWEELGAMTYDQRAMVDYEVLKRAGRVFGQGGSRFSWGVAVARAAAYGETPVSEVPAPGEQAPGVVWEDEFTKLVGTQKAEREAFVQSTWP